MEPRLIERIRALAEEHAEPFYVYDTARIVDLCRAFSGTSVLDPYLGSGTTLAACAKLGIQGTGIEIEEKYCEMAAARLSDDVSYGKPNLFNLEAAE